MRSLRAASQGRPLLLLQRSLLRIHSTRSVSSSSFDVVVAGGGMVGSAVAAAIASKANLKEKRILVLEAVKPKDYSFPNDYSNRVSAINTGSQKLFQDVGAWKHIQDFRCKPVRGMHVWDSDGALLSFPPEKSHMFHIVENDLMVDSLSRTIRECRNVEISYGKGVKTVADLEGGVQVTLASREGDDEELIETRLLVGADGANSTVRKRGFTKEDNPYLARNYEQMGVVATLKLSRSIPNEVAWQKFVAGSGPIALLPLTEDRSSLVWTLPTKAAQHALKLTPEDFVQELRLFLGSFPKVEEPAPEVEEASQIAAFPLGFGHSSRYCRRGIVLVGDAAHRIHPLAGQGVNLGFGDAACLSRHLSEGADLGERFASRRRLLDYETERQRSNLPVMLGVDFLQRVYTVEHGLFGAARAAGMAAVDASPVVKRILAGLAAG